MKKYIILLCILSSLFVYAEKDIDYEHAETLNKLGLFLGTDKGYELDKDSTRSEAAVMLVRLLGCEDIALNTETSHPFRDVPAWASPYVSYLYNNKLTSGIGKYTYGSNEKITINQYTTMVLRALNHKDSEGLFLWSDSLGYANKIGLIDDEELGIFENLNGSIKRRNMVTISYNSLFTNVRNKDFSLIEDLYNNRAIKEKNIDYAKAIDNRLEEIAFKENEMRAIWISYLEFLDYFKDNEYSDKQSFINYIDNMFSNISSTGLNTVIVQARPFGDAIYKSEYFPSSYVTAGEEGKELDYDILKIMIDKAHSYDIKLEAWVNPFRIRNKGNIDQPIDSSSIGYKWLNDGSNRVFKIDSGIYYNPASEDVRKLVVDGINEIVENYDIDGIHLDDYFYPSGLSYDLPEYNKYVDNGGSMSQADFRRDNINILVKDIYNNVKSIDSYVSFGISPRAIIDQNYNQEYADIKMWMSNPGYIDYICPQIYFGYDNTKYPYYDLLSEWDSIDKDKSVSLYIGMPAYKIGLEDRWAGEGKQEFINEEAILSKMVLDARNMSNCDGFILFRYDHMYNPSEYTKYKMNKEIDYLKKIML